MTASFRRLCLMTALGLGPIAACESGGAGAVEMRSAESTPDDGCTLTQGYWKNHSSQSRERNRRDRQQEQERTSAWPENPYFDEDTIFMDNGFEGIPGCPDRGTYLDVLRTPPRGDVYVILAHQYIAAKLNLFGGVDDPDAWALIGEAFQILSDCTVDSSESARAHDLAEALTGFNEGAWGPGHCDGLREDRDDD